MGAMINVCDPSPWLRYATIYNSCYKLLIEAFLTASMLPSHHVRPFTQIPIFALQPALACVVIDCLTVHMDSKNNGKNLLFTQQQLKLTLLPNRTAVQEMQTISNIFSLWSTVWQSIWTANNGKNLLVTQQQPKLTPSPNRTAAQEMQTISNIFPLWAVHLWPSEACNPCSPHDPLKIQPWSEFFGLIDKVGLGSEIWLQEDLKVCIKEWYIDLESSTD